MTDNPCNCSTCTVPKNIEYPKWCPVIEEWVAPNYPEKTFILRKCGCLSHHGVRKYLMAPVIAELERQATELESREPFIGTRMECEGLRNMYAMASGMRRAISLIRDGVKHESIRID
jgi:hypothetical protein